MSAASTQRMLALPKLHVGARRPACLCPQVEEFVNSWAHTQNGITKTPKYASWVSPSGALPEAANAALIAWIYTTHSGATGFYKCWAEFQLRYILGDGHQSYVVGHGNSPPVRPQHKGASCAGQQPLVSSLPTLSHQS